MIIPKIPRSFEEMSPESNNNPPVSHTPQCRLGPAIDAMQPSSSSTLILAGMEEAVDAKINNAAKIKH